MSVSVFVHDESVEIELTGLDQVWALTRHVHLDVADIVTARIATQDELKADLSWRVGGTWWPGRAIAGHFASKGRPGHRQLWSAYRDAEVLLIETRLDNPWRVVLQHPDRHNLAWLIAERIPHEQRG